MRRWGFRPHQAAIPPEGSDQMKAVLGIDAAWTLTRPSGVALAARDAAWWRLIAATPSYREFNSLEDQRESEPEGFSDVTPRPDALLASASLLCGTSVDLVAIDMPLARSPISGRRKSDDVVSTVYGARKCGTHSPSISRPGQISADLTKSFEQAGYPLQTEVPVRQPGLIEVYPHPALVELAGASERLPYKASKVTRYWPSLTRAERRVRLYRQWSEIVALLEKEITGVAAALPKLATAASGIDVKAYEDALDAVICAWVAVCAVEGRAKPLGDENSAIWIPNFMGT